MKFGPHNTHSKMLDEFELEHDILFSIKEPLESLAQNVCMFQCDLVITEAVNSWRPSDAYMIQ